MASATRSSSARRAAPSSIAASAESAAPAHVAAVRIASRPNHGSRASSPGSPSTAITRAPEKTTRWLSEARMPAPRYQARSTSTPSARST